MVFNLHGNYLDSYSYYIALEKKLAKGTVKVYTKELIKFFDFISGELREINMEDIVEDEELVKKYIYKLVEKDKNSERTVNRKITILRNFFNYIAASKQFISRIYTS